MLYSLTDPNTQANISFESYGEELEIEVFVPHPSGHEVVNFKLNKDQMTVLKSMLDKIIIK